MCYRFRQLIYQRPFDKQKFADICLKKKEKIDQIALENCLPSIFKESGQQGRYLEKFFGQAGLPNFCYRDEYQSRVKGYWDIFYYFIEGSSVRLVKDDEVFIGRVKQCKINEKQVFVNVENQVATRSFNEVTRIFPSTFYSDFFK
jgi:hypothetical protein